MRFVVDCSVSVAWYVEDESNRYTEAALRSLMEEGAVAPCLWRTEFTNAIPAERRRRITAAKRRAILEHAEQLPDRHRPSPPALAHLAALAADQGLTGYDAAYLELSVRLRLPLATQDGDLRKAAKTVGVALFA